MADVRVLLAVATDQARDMAIVRLLTEDATLQQELVDKASTVPLASNPAMRTS